MDHWIRDVLIGDLLKKGLVTPEQIADSDLAGVSAYARYEAELLCKDLPKDTQLTGLQVYQKLYTNILRRDPTAFHELQPPPKNNLTDEQSSQLRWRVSDVLNKKPNRSWQRLQFYAFAWNFLPLPLRYFTHEAAAGLLSSLPQFTALSPKCDETISAPLVRKFQRILHLHTAKPLVVYGFRCINGKGSLDYDKEALAYHRLKSPA